MVVTMICISAMLLSLVWQQWYFRRLNRRMDAELEALQGYGG
jgi:uncharacterized membrane protein YccC